MIGTTKLLPIEHTKLETLDKQGLRLNPVRSRAVSVEGIREYFRYNHGYIPKLARPSSTATHNPTNQ